MTDLCVIENTHSIASASQDGQIHVWCVELACRINKKNLKGNEGNVHRAVSPGDQTLGLGLSVRGLSVVRTLNPADGSITALKHFTSLMTSVVTYTTLRGSVVGWDLRSTGEAFHYTVRPEFGVSTCMVLPPGGSGQGWIILGTSRGYLLMWDLRFNVLSAAWRHSSNGSIHKISCFRSHSSSNGNAFNSSKSFPSSGHDDDEEDTYDTVDMDAEISNSSSFPSLRGLKARKGSGAGGFTDYLVIAAGLNEMAVWSLPISADGASIKTFRAIPIATRKDKGNHLDAPHLISVPLPSHPSAPIQSAILSLVSPSQDTKSLSEPSIRAFVAYISPDDKSSYLISGGTDSLLRYWDWSTPSKCSVLSGLSAGQQRPSVVSVRASPVSSSSFVRSGSRDGTEIHDMYGDQPTAGHRDHDPRQSQCQGQGQSEVRGQRNIEGQNEAQAPNSNDLFVCYDTEPPSRSMKSPSFQQAHLPLRDSKGTNQSVYSSEVSLPLYIAALRGIIIDTIMIFKHLIDFFDF